MSPGRATPEQISGMFLDTEGELCRDEFQDGPDNFC